MHEGIQDFLKRAAENTGFVREKYIEQNIPTNMNNIFLFMFFGDLRSQFVTSSLLLNRYKEENKDKYMILCGLPGYSSLYPYVDEYWSLKDCPASLWFQNDESKIAIYYQQLHRYFSDIRDTKEIDKWYHNGLTKEFFDKFGQVVYSLPGIPSPKLSFIQSTGKIRSKIFIAPLKFIKIWRRGKEEVLPCKSDFWANMINYFVNNGYNPIVLRNDLCHDVSVLNGGCSKCTYCSEQGIIDILSVMRNTECLVDVFSDTDKLAMIARCPYVSCVDRNRYNSIKDYELEDLCAYEIPHKYIFATTTMIEVEQWKELSDNIMSKLEDFELRNYPPAAELSVVVPYERVKIRKQKKIGSRFIKVPRI